MCIYMYIYTYLYLSIPCGLGRVDNSNQQLDTNNLMAKAGS